ncbi:MAG: YraN family protein [Bacteroidales bacterium]|nr:YraN family protein [Bacteroidales bacterium]
MFATKQEIGQRAEQIAVDYLLAQGFTIRATNWRMGHKEIDIVAEKNDRLHIVEVRSLTTSFFQQPYQSIDRVKERHLIATANAYVRYHRLSMEVQLDVVSIVFDGESHSLDYFPNAIYPKA